MGGDGDGYVGRWLCIEKSVKVEDQSTSVVRRVSAIVVPVCVMVRSVIDI